MTAPDDPRIREAFATLRREERADVPPVASLLAGRGAGVRRMRPAAAAWSAMAAVAAVMVFGGVRLMQARAAARDAAVVAAALGPFGQARWRSPTDGLLETPGYQALVTVPPIALPGGVP